MEASVDWECGGTHGIHHWHRISDGEGEPEWSGRGIAVCVGSWGYILRASHSMPFIYCKHPYICFVHGLRSKRFPSIRYGFSIFGRVRIGAQFSRGLRLKTRTNWHCFDGKRSLRGLLRSRCSVNCELFGSNSVTVFIFTTELFTNWRGIETSVWYK